MKVPERLPGERRADMFEADVLRAMQAMLRKYWPSTVLERMKEDETETHPRRVAASRLLEERRRRT